MGLLPGVLYTTCVVYYNQASRNLSRSKVSTDVNYHKQMQKSGKMKSIWKIVLGSLGQKSIEYLICSYDIRKEQRGANLLVSIKLFYVQVN